MSQSTEPTDAGDETKRLAKGLNHLGLRADSHRGVLHLWARKLPTGMFDGHRSALVAPDHLVYLGITKRIVAATFKLLTVPQRKRVSISLREALAHSHFSTTSVYNCKRQSIASLGISEWAATLTVFGAVLRRTLRSATRPPGAELSPLDRALEVVRVYNELATALYFCPRPDVDGGFAFRNRASTEDLKARANEFFALVRQACLRVDMAAFGKLLDVPNLHRLRELLDHVLPALLHIRHAQELLFENAHQQLKRAVVTGNGHADAARAMSRYISAEVVSRMKANPSVFGIPGEWLDHPGVRACLLQSHGLSSAEPGAWRCSNEVQPTASLPVAAQQIAVSHSPPGATITWHRRAARPPCDSLVVGDAVAVLVRPEMSVAAVPVAIGVAATAHDARIAFFGVLGFFTTRAGAAAAVVHPYELDPSGQFWRLAPERCLFVLLESVRRALVLHDCACSCSIVGSRVRHTTANRWLLFGRSTGYPARSG